MADNNLQWKQKYYDSLDDLEEREKKWQALEDLFKQAISRLTLAAEGSSKSLDNSLGDLRTAIRKGKDNRAIQLILENVSKEIIKLDKMSKGTPKGDAGFLLKIIQQLHLSGSSEKKSRKLIKHLKAKNPPEQAELITEFQALLSAIVKQAIKDSDAGNSHSESSSDGFFKRLFSAKQQDESIDNELPPKLEETKENSITVDTKDASINSVEVDSYQEQEKLALNQEQMSSVVATVQNVLESIIDGFDINDDTKERLKTKVFEVKPTKEIHILLGDLHEILKESGLVDCADLLPETMLTSDIHEINSGVIEYHDLLIRLIEFLPLEEKIKDQAEKLKEKFSQGINDDHLVDALKSIAELIGMMRRNVQQEQKEFEQFLTKLTGRLAQVDRYLEESIKTNKSSHQSGIELDDAVKEQVKDIGHTVSSVKNIEEMEHAVQSHLDKILTHINHHRETEDKRIAHIEEQNKQLSGQLKQLEGETGQLRQQLIDTHNKALLDPLTQLPNRLAYDERLKQEYSRWKRYNSTLLIMVWDIDFFKKVNDTYGHQAGDKVLKIIADLLQKNLRETDFIARFGGEEFVGLMPETTLGGGYKIAEKIRTAVEKLDFHYRGDNVKITISCGISLFIENDTPETAFSRADKALYQAKDKGRNRCVIIDSLKHE